MSRDFTAAAGARRRPVRVQRRRTVALLAAALLGLASHALPQRPPAVPDDGRALLLPEPEEVVRQVQELLVRLQAEGLRLEPTDDAAVFAPPAGGAAGALAAGDRPAVVLMKAASSNLTGEILRSLREHLTLVDPPGWDAVHLLPPAALDLLALSAPLRPPAESVPVLPFLLRVVPTGTASLHMVQVFNVLDAEEPLVFEAAFETSGAGAAMAELAAALRRARGPPGRLHDLAASLSQHVQPSALWPLVLEAPEAALEPEAAERAAAWLREQVGDLYLDILPHHMLRADVLQPAPRRELVRVQVTQMPEWGLLVRGEVVGVEVVQRLPSPATPPGLAGDLFHYLSNTTSGREFPLARDPQGNSIVLGYGLLSNLLKETWAFRRRLQARPWRTQLLCSDIAGGPPARLALDFTRPPTPAPPPDLFPGIDPSVDATAFMAWMNRGGSPDPAVAARVWEQSWFGPDLDGLIAVEPLPLRGRVGRSEVSVHAPMDLGPLNRTRHPVLLQMGDGIDFVRELTGRRTLRRIALVGGTFPATACNRERPDLLVCETALLELSRDGFPAGAHAAALGLEFALELTDTPPLRDALLALRRRPDWVALARDWRMLELSPRPSSEQPVPVAEPEIFASVLLVLARDLIDAWPARELDDEAWIEQGARACGARLAALPDPSRTELLRLAAALLESLKMKGVGPHVPLVRLLEVLNTAR